MTIRRYFSKNNSSTPEKDLVTDLGTGAAALGAIYGGEALAKNAYSKFYQKAEKDLNSPSSKKEIDKLLEYAKSRKIHVENNPEFRNSAYVGGPGPSFLRKITTKIAKKLKKDGKREEAEELIKEFKSNPIGKSLGKNAVVMGMGANNSGALAHELGHAEHLMKGGNGGVVGKIAHRLDTPSRLILQASAGSFSPELSRAANRGIKIGVNSAFAGGGFRRGKNSVSTDENGKIKVNKKKALISAGIGLGVVAPTLIAEAAASKKGLKLLKELGASKESLKANKKTLKEAFGTYAASGMFPLISETAGHGAGVVYGVNREKRKKRKS